MLSCVRLFVTLYTTACQVSLPITNIRSLLKLMSIESVMPFNLSSSVNLLLLPSILPSIRVFSKESVLCIRWPKCWSFSFSISPSNEYSGLISFRMDWLDLLAVQRTLKVFSNTAAQKPSIPQHSAFFMVQLSHPYMTTGKAIALTRWTFVGQVMSLLFNTLSRLEYIYLIYIPSIAFLPRSKFILLSCLQSPSSVISEPKKIKSLTVSIVSSSICHEMMGLDAMIFVFWMLSFKPAFSTPFFHLHQEAFQFLFTFCHNDAVICISEVIDISPGNLDCACASASLAFHMMYSAYELNKQGDNIQPWCIPFPILNQSIVPCPVLTLASWSAYRFLRKQVRWFGIPISWRISHSLLWSIQSKTLAYKAEVDVFLEFSCFFYEPTDVGNKSYRERQILYNITYMWNLKNI